MLYLIVRELAPDVSMVTIKISFDVYESAGPARRDKRPAPGPGFKASLRNTKAEITWPVICALDDQYGSDCFITPRPAVHGCVTLPYGQYLQLIRRVFIPKVKTV